MCDAPFTHNFKTIDAGEFGSMDTKLSVDFGGGTDTVGLGKGGDGSGR